MEDRTEQQKFKILIKNLKSRSFMPVITNNRELIEKFFPEIKAKYPQAKVFYFSKKEYVCLTSEAEYFLVRFLEEHIEDLQKDIEESKQTLAQVKAQKGGK